MTKSRHIFLRLVLAFDFGLGLLSGCQSMTWLPDGLYNMGCDQRIGVINNLRLSLGGEKDCGSPEQLKAALECFRKYHCTDVVICGQVTAHASRREFRELAKWYASYFSSMGRLEIHLSQWDLTDHSKDPNFLLPTSYSFTHPSRLWWNLYRVPWDKSVEEPYPVPQGITFPDTGTSGDVLILTRSGEKYDGFNIDL